MEQQGAVKMKCWRRNKTPKKPPEVKRALNNKLTSNVLLESLSMLDLPTSSTSDSMPSSSTSPVLSDVNMRVIQEFPNMENLKQPIKSPRGIKNRKMPVQIMQTTDNAVELNLECPTISDQNNIDTSHLFAMPVSNNISTIITSNCSTITTSNITSQSIASKLVNQSSVGNINSHSIASNINSQSIACKMTSQSISNNIMSQSIANNMQSQSTASNMMNQSIANNMQNQSIASNMQSQSIANNMQNQSISNCMQSQSLTSNMISQSLANTNLKVVNTQTFANSGQMINISQSMSNNQTLVNNNKMVINNISSNVCSVYVIFLIIILKLISVFRNKYFQLEIW